MMLFEKIIDVQTGQEELKEYTPEQIKDNEQIKKELNAIKIKVDEIAENRKSALAKLIDLGLTEEEIAAL